MSILTESKADVGAHAGKYLTIVLAGESYGLAVLKIREIIRLPKITPVPQLPACVKGVINLRGRVIPIVDLRAKLDLPAAFTERTCIVVAQVGTSPGASHPMGLVVDAVEEVVNFTAADIAPAPDFGVGAASDSLLGMARVKGQVKTLLDLDRVLAGTLPGATEESSWTSR